MKVSRNGLVGSIDKSRRFRRIVGLRSHCIRPTESLKPDCECPLQRKAGRLTPFGPEQCILSSPLCGRRLQNTGIFRVFRDKRRALSLRLRLAGGEGGILVTSFPATTNETYTSVIIACVCAGRKPFSSSVPVSTVSLIVPVSHQNGITGITIRQMFSFKGMGGLK
jgi:hypothetical protein